MDKPETLADYLGTLDPQPVVVARPLAPAVKFKDLKGEAFALAVLNSIEFRQYIVDGLRLGEIAPAVMLRLMDYGWGKPPDKLEIKDTTDALEDLTFEQLETRAEKLRDLARQLRTNDEVPPSASVERDEGAEHSIVH